MHTAQEQPWDLLDREERLILDEDESANPPASADDWSCCELPQPTAPGNVEEDVALDFGPSAN